MKDYTPRPEQGNATAAIAFCLECLFRDKRHSVKSKVVSGLSFEELIRALTLAMNEIQQTKGRTVDDVVGICWFCGDFIVQADDYDSFDDYEFWDSEKNCHRKCHTDYFEALEKEWTGPEEGNVIANRDFRGRDDDDADDKLCLHCGKTFLKMQMGQRGFHEHIRECRFEQREGRLSRWKEELERREEDFPPPQCVDCVGFSPMDDITDHRRCDTCVNGNKYSDGSDGEM